MRIDFDIYSGAAKKLSEAGGGNFGPGSERLIKWCLRKSLPVELVRLFTRLTPLEEAWAGAGAIFPGGRIIQWNDDYPEAVIAGLLIVGSAANGDHIAIELQTGQTGYINHEADWIKSPKDSFATAASSFGRYLSDINFSPNLVPEDFCEAIRSRQ